MHNHLDTQITKKKLCYLQTGGKNSKLELSLYLSKDDNDT